MIVSFSDKETEKLYRSGQSKRFREIERIALRKLDMLEAAVNLDALRIPPGNRLEALRGDRQGQYSIRINERWYLCFCWNGIDAYDVEIVDYH